MRKLILSLLVCLLCAPNLYAYSVFLTYDDNILQGKVLFFKGDTVPGNLSPIFYGTFTIQNKTKNAINLKRVIYCVEAKDGSIYRLENPTIQFNDGIYNSYILNPHHKAEVRCKTPFTEYSEIENIKEAYIELEDNKRIFFVRYDDVKEYQKVENKALRHLRNLWWNIK